MKTPEQTKNYLPKVKDARNVHLAPKASKRTDAENIALGLIVLSALASKPRKKRWWEYL